MQAPGTPSGTRDFSSCEMMRRNYIFDAIRGVFRLHGFNQIETPAMENMSTLTGKYGEEGDRLMFRILNSGNFLSRTKLDDLHSEDYRTLSNRICEKGLRYDLTVPFARYVCQHRHELTFPFRRYQIQPVWRADRPQRGRYREFYQCDADIIGSKSLLNELELLQIIDEVFKQLNLRVVINLNSRKILTGVTQTVCKTDRISDVSAVIDKLDRFGMEYVTTELMKKGVHSQSIASLEQLLFMTGTNEEKLCRMKEVLAESEIGMEGVTETENILKKISRSEISTGVEFDLALARGLDYYTGTIIEVKSLDLESGSIAGGGRYDNLTGIFGLQGMSGVGVSFGAERIYDIMDKFGLFPENSTQGTKIMFVNFGDSESEYLLPIISSLRKGGIPTELFPDAIRMKKQLAYASERGIPFVGIAGEAEISCGKIVLKKMQTGNQENVAVEDIVAFVQNCNTTPDS
ncbi:MAG: histidine--tRNA ligase [Dysgonamonadaceae bacterium]|jgi:histidyl-tRNA synthetase|nr:histidine--tRNA ligase [Dysgonamonadaceae bacterium]